jgi:hypothetical protein
MVCNNLKPTTGIRILSTGDAGRCIRRPNGTWHRTTDFGVNFNRREDRHRLLAKFWALVAMAGRCYLSSSKPSRQSARGGTIEAPIAIAADAGEAAVPGRAPPPR